MFTDYLASLSTLFYSNNSEIFDLLLEIVFNLYTGFLFCIGVLSATKSDFLLFSIEEVTEIGVFFSLIPSLN
jgi:hypothetical protein